MRLPGFFLVSLVLVGSARANEETASNEVRFARAGMQRGASRKGSNRRMSPDVNNSQVDSKRGLMTSKGGKGDPCQNAVTTLTAINTDCLSLNSEVQNTDAVVTDYCSQLFDITDDAPPPPETGTEVVPLETAGKVMDRNCKN